MVKPSQRLQTVLKLAKLRQKQAADHLSQSLQAVDAQEQQKQQLKSYQDDYNTQFKLQEKQPIDALRLNNYQHFFNNLENAVEAQNHRKESADKALELSRRQWQQLYSRQKNMESLVEAKRQCEAREEEKKIQRVFDDRIVASKILL